MKSFIPQIFYKPEGEPSGETPPTPTPPATPPAVTPAPKPEEKQPWYLERIDTLTRKNYELAAQVEQKQTPPPAATPPAGKTYTQAELDQLSNQKAVQLVDVNSFNNACNKVYADGVAAHPDFQAKLHMVNTLSGGIMSRDLIEAAMEAGNAEEILYELGSKPDVAQEILALSPAKMAVRLARLAGELKAPPQKKQSGAPDPITPRVKGETVTELALDSPELSTKDWMERRNKELRDKQKARA